jgi:hypothetical protein
MWKPFAVRQLSMSMRFARGLRDEPRAWWQSVKLGEAASVARQDQTLRPLQEYDIQLSRGQEARLPGRLEMPGAVMTTGRLS